LTPSEQSFEGLALTTDRPITDSAVAESTVIISGASTGIGRFAATNLASMGATLILVGRSTERHKTVLEELAEIGGSFRMVECDLGHLSSVAAAAASIEGAGTNQNPVVLINNAAAAGRRGVTADGFELAFGVNYLAHFLLTLLLLDSSLTVETVVNVSSNAQYSVPRLDPDMARGKTRSLAGWREYSHSKAAMAAMAIELSERRPAVKSLAVHPGLVSTGLWRRIPQPFRALVTRRMVPPEAGALPLVQAAIDPALPSGSYLTPSGIRTPGKSVIDPVGRSELWDASLAWVEAFL
jgi:retinol dehydrogenase-12